jgi:excisionase family DNA binding protein
MSFAADSSEPDRPQPVKAGAVAAPLRGFGLDGLMPPRFGLSKQTKADWGRTAHPTRDEEVAAWFYCGPSDYLFAGPECIAVRVTGCQSPPSILFSAVSALQPSGDHLRLLILSLRPLRTRHSVAQRRLRLFIYAKTRDTMRTMAHPRKYHDHVSTNKALSSVDNDKSTGADPIDPSALGFAKVAYAVDETLELLSIGRTALYAAVKRGDLKRVKFGKKTLFYAADLAAFLARLRHLSGSDESRVDRAPRQISSPKCKIDLPGS